MIDEMINPTVWPVCHGIAETAKKPAQQCRTPYVLKRSMTGRMVQDSDGKNVYVLEYRWNWMPGCKHRVSRATVVLHNAEGEVAPLDFPESDTP